MIVHNNPVVSPVIYTITVGAIFLPCESGVTIINSLTIECTTSLRQRRTGMTVTIICETAFVQTGMRS